MEYEDDSSEFDGFNTYFSKENRQVVVKTIDGSLIRGNINLNSESIPMDRVSDLLIKGQNKFLIMYNAALGDRKDAAVIINKSQIVWVMEEDATQRKS
ncbi:MAG: hypothetical protein AMJ61_02975 [Desulfobacterales bacterium SG8_35_2]|jgi:protein-arginine kinase|nr:MAG: hypothetical protein AMJ61_02975 [Desulfobacterales bacterium SG8_35_2]